MTNQIVRRAAAIVLLLAAGCTSTRRSDWPTRIPDWTPG